MLKKKTVLVIEDDLDIGMMIKLMLRYKGFEVTLVEQMEEVGDILKRSPPNILIMDMLLSGSNGVEICKELKSNVATSRIPIIMMSAHPDAKTSCLQAGANDFISKPFDMEDMVSKINALTN